MLLAKRLKISTMKKQREYIKKSIFSLASRGVAGDPAFTYSGYIYPEVIQFFEKHDFNVRLISSDIVIATNNGKPLYIFTPKDNIELSEEEMQKAENYVDTQVLNEQLDVDAFAERLTAPIFGHKKN